MVQYLLRLTLCSAVHTAHCYDPCAPVQVGVGRKVIVPAHPAGERSPERGRDPYIATDSVWLQ